MSAPRPSVRVLQLCAVDFTVRQFVGPLALALGKAGFDVQCACTPGPHWQELHDMGLRMVPMPIARSANPIKALGAVLRLARWLRKHRPDVLHVHTPVASMVGRLAAFLARTPLVIYTAHGFYFHDRMPWKKRLPQVALERFFGLFNDYLFCVSSEDAAAAVKLRIARKSRVVHVPNGTDPDRFDPARLRPLHRDRLRAECGFPPDSCVIAIMGRLVREKGYFEFFAAAQRLAPRFPNARFLVIGDTVSGEHDDAKARILAAAAHPALAGRVHFAGLRSDVPELLSAADIFVLPSYREGMPVSILEAMAMELPVVATRIRGCREEVAEGVTGFLVEPHDAEELEGALAYLLGHRDVAEEMGRSARRMIVERFDERVLFARQARLYRKLVTRTLR